MDGGSPVCSFMSSHSRYVNRHKCRNLKFFLCLKRVGLIFRRVCQDVVLDVVLCVEHIQLANVFLFGNSNIDFCLLVQGLGCHNIHVCSFEF